MGILNKLFGKKDEAPKPEEAPRPGPVAESVSPGGSSIYRYENEEAHGPRPPERCCVYAEEINAHFGALFPGREVFVYHELVSDLVHIDVNIMRPTPEKNYYVLFTTGMSDLPMTLPGELADREDLKYAELFLFLPGDWNLDGEWTLGSDIPYQWFWPIQTLKFLARFPHAYHTWLGWGHSIPNGPDYTPLCGGVGFGGCVLGHAGGGLGGMDARDGRRISFYLVIPAYREEIEYKLEKGMKALDELYAEKGLPVVLDVNRPNFCAGPSSGPA